MCEWLLIYLFIYLHRHGNVALLDKQGHKKNHNDAAKIKAWFNWRGLLEFASFWRQ